MSNDTDPFERVLGSLSLLIVGRPITEILAHVTELATGGIDAADPWPEFGEAAASRGIHCTLSWPLMAGDAGIGALNLYGRRHAGFGDEDVDHGPDRR